MAKRYTHDQAGEYGAKPKAYREASGKNSGYDFVDPQAGRLAKAAAKGIGKGIVRIVAGPKKGK